MRADVRLSCSRQAIDILLGSKPKRSTLKARAEAVEKLAADINRFAPWPALARSLMEDAQRLRRSV